MKNKVLFVFALAIFLVSLFSVGALYKGTIGLNVGTGSAYVNLTGPTAYVNVTNSTGGSTLPSGGTTTAGGGSVGVTGATLLSDTSNETSNQSQSENFTPVSLNSDESTGNLSSGSPSSSSSNFATGAINLAGNVVSALGTTTGLSISGIVVVGLGVLIFVLSSRERKLAEEIKE